MDERELAELHGRQMGVRFVDLEQLVVEPDMARLVPEHLARRYQVFPVDLKDNRLTLAMHDPLNVIALDDIRLATGFDLDPVIAIKRHLQKLVHDQFGESPGEAAPRCELDGRLYHVAVSDRGQLVLPACPEATSSRSVRFLAKPDDFRHWVGFESDSYSWLLAPTGQRIVLDINGGELLGSLPDDHLNTTPRIVYRLASRLRGCDLPPDLASRRAGSRAGFDARQSRSRTTK